MKQTQHDTLFAVLDEKSRAYKAELGNRFRQNLSYLVLFFVLAFTVLLPFTTLGVTSFFTAAFVADTLYMTLCTYSAYLLFLPMGKTNGKAKSVSYFPSLSRWSALSDDIRAHGALSAFDAFCKARMETERTEKRRAIVEGCCLDMSVYLAQFAAETPREVYEKARAAGFSYRRARKLSRAAAHIRVRTIAPMRILCGASRVSLNDAGRGRISYETRQVVKKPISCILLSVLLAGVVIYPTASIGIGVLFTVVARVLGVLLSACSGFSVGVSAVAAETEEMRVRILFLSAFFEAYAPNQTEIAG